MTPLQAQMLLHFYACRAEFPGIQNEPQQAALRWFADEGVIDWVDGIPITTDLGRAWVHSILSTPIPKAQYVDGNGKVIKEP